jgi:hypothetical protein
MIMSQIGVVKSSCDHGPVPDTLAEYLDLRPFVLYGPAAPVRGATAGLHPWHSALPLTYILDCRVSVR